MADLGVAHVQIQASARGITAQLQRELGEPLSRAADRAGGESARKFGDRFRSSVGTAIKAAAASAALVGAVALGRDAISAASDLEETQSKVNTVFGEGASIVNEWAQTAAGAIGQSQQQALDAAGSFGNMFTQIGIGSEAAAGMSVEMTNLASDFASFHNADITEVLQAQQAAFRGEYDAVQRFVPTINAAAVEQKALEMGLASTTSELDAQDKALATQALLLEGAGAAAGDFQRTSGSLANQQRILSARWDNAKATLGRGLLPVVTRVTTWLAESMLPAVQRLAAEWMPRLSSWFAATAGVVASVWPSVVDVFRTVFDGLREGIEFVVGNKPVLIGVLTAIGVGFAAWAVGAASAAAATLAAAAPFIAIGAAIAAVVAGIVYAYTEWEWFRDVVDSVADGAVAAFHWVRDAVKSLWDRSAGLRTFLAGAFSTGVGVATIAVDALRTAFTKAREWAQLIWDKTSGLRSFLAGAFFGGVIVAKVAVDLLKTAFTTAMNVAGWLWDKSEGLRGFLAGAFSTGVGIAVGVVGGLVTIFSAARTVAGWLWDKVKTVVSNLNGIGVGGILGAIGSVITAMGNLVSKAVEAYNAVRKALGANVSGSVAPGAFSRVDDRLSGARASGGPVQAGGTYRVNERGWELFTPNRDGYILSHRDSVKAMGRSAVNVTVHNHRSVAGQAEIARGLTLAGVA